MYIKFFNIIENFEFYFQESIINNRNTIFKKDIQNA